MVGNRETAISFSSSTSLRSIPAENHDEGSGLSVRGLRHRRLAGHVLRQILEGRELARIRSCPADICVTG